MPQVVASQKQLELKYNQAQQTAVSAACRVPPPASACWEIAWAVAAESVEGHHIGCCSAMGAPGLQDDWFRRAELALGKGEEELAREALKRRKAYAVRSAPLPAASAAAARPPPALRGAALLPAAKTALFVGAGQRSPDENSA